MPRLISLPPVGRWNKGKKRITLSSKTYESLHEVVAATAAAGGKTKKEHNNNDVNDDNETVVTRGRSSDDTAVLTSSDDDDHTLDNTTADGTLSSAPTHQPSNVHSKPTPVKTLPTKISLLETAGGVETFTPDFWEQSTYIQGDNNKDNDDLQLLPARLPTYTDEAMEVLLANEEDVMSASSSSAPASSMSTDLLESPYPLVRDWSGPAGMRFWSLKRTRDECRVAEDEDGAAAARAPAHWATLPPRWSHSEMVEPEEKFVPVPAGMEDDIEMGYGVEVKRMKMHVEPLGFEVERVDL